MSLSLYKVPELVPRKPRREYAPIFYDMISPLRADYIVVFHVMDWCNYYGFSDQFHCLADEPELTKSIETNQILATIADMLLPSAATEEEE